MSPGFEDPVARSIRNEQNRDAAPSPEEQEMLREREETIHIQYKAIEYLIEQQDWPFNYDVVVALADYFKYEELPNIERWDWDGRPRGPTFPERHELAAERPDDPDLSPRFDVPAFDERYDVPSDPDQYDLIGGDLEEIDVRSGEMILNPFAAKKARVAVIEDVEGPNIYTNDVFERAMDDERWSDSFDDETIDRYQEELLDLHEHVVTGGDD